MIVSFLSDLKDRPDSEAFGLSVQNGPFDQFNFINQSISRDQSFFVLIGQIAFS